jgi:hypothetical protein
VYYSYPVPRTYGYSPFAYPPYVMTPEVAQQAEPVQIVNPYVPKTEVKLDSDRNASTNRRVEPLVIVNPFVTPTRAVAQSGS